MPVSTMTISSRTRLGYRKVPLSSCAKRVRVAKSPADRSTPTTDFSTRYPRHIGAYAFNAIPGVRNCFSASQGNGLRRGWLYSWVEKTSYRFTERNSKMVIPGFLFRRNNCWSSAPHRLSTSPPTCRYRPTPNSTNSPFLPHASTTSPLTI